MGALLVRSLKNEVLNYQWRLVEVAATCDSLTHSLIHTLRHAVFKDTIYLPKLLTQNFLHLFVCCIQSSEWQIKHDLSQIVERGEGRGKTGNVLLTVCLGEGRLSEM